MSEEEEDIILDNNPAPEDIDRFIDKLNAHNQASPALKKFLVYIKERQAYGPDLCDEYVYFCLSSYFILKNNYKEVSLGYELPPESFLRNVFSKLSFKPGITDIFLELLKIKTEHCKPDSRICVLLIDEIALSPCMAFFEKYGTLGYADTGDEIANFVTTIWIASVSVKTCLPLAYYFTNKSCSADLLQRYLFEAITKLNSIGIEVIGVVAKVKRNLLRLSQNLNISTDVQTFKVGDKTVLFLFDVHHLINITRDNFLTYKFEVFNMSTSPKHVGRFFFAEWQHADSTTLSKSHLVPDRKQRTFIQYATELLNANVAYAMKSYISAGKMPKSAKGTADCIETLHYLFNIMNSTTMGLGNPLHCGYHGSPSQVEFMQFIILFFENLKVFDISDNDRTDQLIFKKAWLISIKGMMQLWEVMKQKNYPHLFTNYVSFELVDTFVRDLLNFEDCAYKNPPAWLFLVFYETFFAHQYFMHWPRDYSPNNGEFNIDEDYAQKVYERIPAISHDLTGKMKVDKTFFPELKKKPCHFIEFIESWADHCELTRADLIYRTDG